jgi:glycosyltransferase involved in cell wall biosynthesis
MKVRPPKILFVATDLSTGGGVNKVIRDLAALFRRGLGADVTVVNARDDRGSSYAFPADVPVESHRKQSLVSYFLLLLGLRGLRPDFVISSWAQDNILVTLAFLFSSTKVVLVEHASWHFHGAAIRLLRRLIYPLAWRVVVLNRRDLDHHSRFLRNVRLIPNPVSLEPAAAPEARDKLILAIGHLEPLKNFEDAIRAFAQSNLEEDGWSLAIVGSGSSEAALRGLIAELRLKRTVVRTGAEDIGPWYQRTSMLLVTSRIESFSLVLAEAMLTGVVPIAYASDGPSFILEDFADLLVPIGDLKALSARISQLAHGRDHAALKERLSASIQNRFSPDVVLERWRSEVFATAGAGN